jgi:anti-sigma factor RsiW
MKRTDSHPTREELLLAADGELAPGRTERLQKHLSACWECRSRMRELEEAIADYVRLHRRNLDPMLPPAAGPRALLKAHLHELAASRASRRYWFDAVAWRRGLAAVAAICIAVSIGFWMRRQWATRPESKPYAFAVPFATPNAQLTPGVARAASQEEVCSSESPPKNRMVPVSVRRRVFGAYGIDGVDPRAYEVDYLITPALGGSDDIRNLWPQSYSATVWNARVKDALEDRLHELVCAGHLDLATAQRDISRDWIAAYKYYFHTDRPIDELPH